jgi:hypothetical protein
MSTPTRPTPLKDVAGDTATIVGILGSVLSGLIGFGLVTAQQGDAITGLLGLIPGLVTGITAVIAAFRTAHKGAELVTPLNSPQNAAGERLIPVGDHGKHERLADS